MAGFSACLLQYYWNSRILGERPEKLWETLVSQFQYVCFFISLKLIFSKIRWDEINCRGSVGSPSELHYQIELHTLSISETTCYNISHLSALCISLIASCISLRKWTTVWRWHQLPGRLAVSQVIDRLVGDSQQLKAEKETPGCSLRGEKSRGSQAPWQRSRLMMVAHKTHTRIEQPYVMSARCY